MRRAISMLMMVTAWSLVPVGGAGAHPVSDAPATRAPTALVLRYRFDADAGGVVRDASPSALHGTLVGADPMSAYASGPPGKGKALSLAGADRSYVVVPERPVLDVNRFTLAAWVRPTGVVGDATNGRWEILEKAGAYWINLRTDGRIRAGGFFGSCGGGSAWIFLDSPAAIPMNAWTHVAGTYDGSRLRVWIVGKQVASKSVSGRTCSNDQPLAVGAKNAPAKGILDAFWDGRLDEVRLYSRALGAGEIATLAA